MLSFLYRLAASRHSFLDFDSWICLISRLVLLTWKAIEVSLDSSVAQSACISAVEHSYF